MRTQQRVVEGATSTDHAHARFEAFDERHQVAQAHHQCNYSGTEEDRLEQFVAVVQQQPAAAKQHEGIERALEQVGVGGGLGAPQQAGQGPGGEDQECERQGLAQ